MKICSVLGGGGNLCLFHFQIEQKLRPLLEVILIVEILLDGRDPSLDSSSLLLQSATTSYVSPDEVIFSSKFQNLGAGVGRCAAHHKNLIFTFSSLNVSIKTVVHLPAEDAGKVWQWRM